MTKGKILLLAGIILGAIISLWVSKHWEASRLIDAANRRANEIAKIRLNETDADALASAKLDKDVYTTVQLPDGSISSAKILSGSIRDAVFDSNLKLESQTNNLTGDQGLISGWQLNDGTSTSVKLLDNAVTAAALLSGTPTELKIINGVIDNGKISSGEIKVMHFPTGLTLDLNVNQGVITQSKVEDSNANDNISPLSFIAAKVATNDIAETKIGAQNNKSQAIVANSIIGINTNSNGTYALSLDKSCSADQKLIFNGQGWDCSNSKITSLSGANVLPLGGNLDDLFGVKKNFLVETEVLSSIDTSELQYTTPGTGTAVFAHKTGSFSGWGFPIGNPKNFNLVSFKINSLDANKIPSRIRVAIRENNENGNILADVTQPIFNLNADGNTELRIFLKTTILNEAGNNLYLQFMTDGFCSFFAYASYAPNYANSTYANNRSLLTFPDRIKNPNPFRQIVTNFYLTNQTDYQDDYLFSKNPKYTSSTYSAWGSPIGTRRKFNRVTLGLKYWDLAAVPPAKLRLIIKDSNKDGAVLADKSITLNLKLGALTIVPVELDNDVDSTNNLWLEFYSDSHLGFLGLNPIIFDDSFGRAYYSTNKLLNGILTTQSTAQTNIWAATSQIDRTQSHYASPSDYADKLKNITLSDFTTLSHSMPEKIYAVEGRELNIYWPNFIKSNFPLNLYRLDVICDKGMQEDNRWTFVPQIIDAGELAWSLKIYYNENLINTIKTKIIVKTLNSGSGVNRKILIIGDSTLGGTGTAAIAELVNLFNYNQASPLAGGADVMNITTLGTINSEAQDATGTMRSFQHEARNGWTINKFYSDPASPFVFSGTFDFNQYLSSNSIPLGERDWVLIHLGINDIFSYTDDTDLNNQLAKMAGQLDAMIKNIQSAEPNIRIGLMVTIPPANSQDAFGAEYGSNQTAARYSRNRSLWAEKMIAVFETGYTNVFLVPLHLNLDTVNNFPTITVPVNARNTATTVIKQNNGLHPASSGYYQMSDSIYMFLKDNED